MKKFLALLMLLMAAMVVAPMALAQACEDEIGCVELEDGDPITIATMLTISGNTAFLGEDSQGGVEIAVEQRDGELLGREIEIVEEDSGCSAEGGQAAAQRVASDEFIVGVIGTNCSSAATAALPILSEAGMVLFSSSATSPSLTALPDDGGVYEPGFYRTAHNDLFQGAIAAEFAVDELGATRLATIHDGSPYADGLQAVMADTFTEMGGEVIFQGAVNVGDTDMNPILTDIAASVAESETDGPLVLYFPIFEPEGNFIAAQSVDVPGLEEAILFGADGILVESFPENTGQDAALGMYFSGPVVQGEAYDEFLMQWEDEIGGVPPAGFHAHAYDAANILLDAIAEVAVEGEDGTLVIGRQALRDAITATEGYAGLTGTLTCSATGDCATGEALGVFQLTEADFTEDAWPPSVVWLPGVGMVEEME